MTWGDRTKTIICEMCGHHNEPEECTWYQGEIIVCKDEAKCLERQAIQKWIEDHEEELEFMTTAPEFPIIDLNEKNPNKAQDRARQIVVDYYNHQLMELGEELHISHVYIVWFSKDLQNWKATVATDINDGMYFEITYDGDKQQAYLDAYKKVSNEVIPDA